MIISHDCEQFPFVWRERKHRSRAERHESRNEREVEETASKTSPSLSRFISRPLHDQWKVKGDCSQSIRDHEIGVCLGSVHPMMSRKPPRLWVTMRVSKSR